MIILGFRLLTSVSRLFHLQNLPECLVMSTAAEVRVYRGIYRVCSFFTSIYLVLG